MMLEEIENYAAQGTDFAFESTLAGKGHLNVIRRLKDRGYRIHFFYLWLPTPETFSLKGQRSAPARGPQYPRACCAPPFRPFHHQFPYSLSPAHRLVDSV
jgi:hypothetical protein